MFAWICVCPLAENTITPLVLITSPPVVWTVVLAEIEVFVFAGSPDTSVKSTVAIILATISAPLATVICLFTVSTVVTLITGTVWPTP